MSKICVYCLDEYKNDQIMSTYKISETGLYQDCPNRSCDGKVYSIDDNLVSTITILNSKGYPTYSSCAGHQLEENTECYIEFSDDVKSIPVLPEGFKLRVKTLDGKSRLSVYRKPVSEDPVDQFSELLDIAEVLYEWALRLDLNFKDTEVFFIDMMNPEHTIESFLDAFYNISKEEEKEPPKETKAKKKLDVDKLKESAPKGSIKLKRTESEQTAEEDIKKESEAKEEPKKKRGRPKKNQD